MTRSEINSIRNALEILRRLVPDDEPSAVDAPSRCPVMAFARRYLAPDPAGDLSSEELWKFYSEIMAAGELPPMRKQAFLRLLPSAMAAVFGTQKSHDLHRNGGRVRGFRGVSIRLDAGSRAVVELETK